MPYLLQYLPRATGIALSVLLCGACGVQGIIYESGIDDEPALSGDIGGGYTITPFITYGQSDPGHASVGTLYSNGAACTATLVGSRTVLTAGHCVPGSTARFTVGGQKIYSQLVRRHPNYGGGNYNDVALVILQQQVQGVSPSPIATGAPQQGQAITLVGYGKTGEYKNDYGTKRQTTNTISKVGSSTFSFYGQQNICNGDSGGPTFAWHGGVEVVIGVHSTKSGWCGNGGTDMRVDVYQQWIKQVAGSDVLLQGSKPSPPQPPKPPPPSSPVKEGQPCASKVCDKGLACVAVTSGGKNIGQWCMEQCSVIGGADPLCDGGEVCTYSSKGPVCFDVNRPGTGFTNPGGGGPPPPGGSPTSCGAGGEVMAFNLLNKERLSQGRAKVACDTAALKVARRHGQDMCQRHYFSHYTPEGLAPWHRLSKAGISFAAAGENIAHGQVHAQDVHSNWMNSAGHRNNMLNPGWKRSAVGVYICGSKPYWIQVFMR